MSKINLTAITSAAIEAKKQAALERVINFVESEVVPALVATAEKGRRSYEVTVPANLSTSDVQNELVKRVSCQIAGCSRTFTVHW